MSRIGKQPVPIPDKVKVDIKGNLVDVIGPKGKLSRVFNPQMKFELKDGNITVIRPNDSKFFKAQHGLTRALIKNMVIGVSAGFKKNLDIIGMGYRAQVKGKELVLQLGFSHPYIFPIHEGLVISVEQNTRIIIQGIDKELVGETAAKIRAIRPPEPYKGKGIRYEGEYVRRKAGKAALTTGGKGA